MKTTRLMVLSDANDATPNVGTSYLAHVIGLKMAERSLTRLTQD